MKAMVLAAGLGTRLRPWTLSHPKALVPVGGVPMLERVIRSLVSEGFDDIVVNVHHFAGQVVDFLEAHEFGARVRVSDESERLLDTGGALVKAFPLLFGESAEPVLVHNVDILSDCRLGDFMRGHVASGSDVSLLVSRRDSSRRLAFDGGMELRGWHNVESGAVRPEGFTPSEAYREYAFSGIYAVGRRAVEEMAESGRGVAFPVMDYFLDPARRCRVRGEVAGSLRLIDIGKPATLSRADALFGAPEAGAAELSCGDA